MIQSVPDIRENLQKLTAGPEGALEELFGAANWVFYNQGQEESEEQEKRLGKNL